MKQLLLLLMLIPAFIWAQDNTKYLAGAVTEDNGKVVFTQEISLPGMPKEQIYNAMHVWAREFFNGDKKRVVYADEVKGNIAAVGEDYLVFTSSALSLDRSLMNYRLTIECEDGKAKMLMSGIRYEYNVSYQRDPEKYIAEDWITDKAALNKGKLNRINGKFRKGTIDYAEEMFKSAAAAILLPSSPIPAAVQQTAAVQTVTQPAVIQPATPVVIPAPAASTTPASLDGYRQVSPDKIPGNIIKMLSEDWMLITAGDDTEFNMMTASWGGLGNAFGKSVATCFIIPSRYTYQLMEKKDTYTFTFYTEAYRDVLRYCGSNSGRDKDKVKETGLTPITTSNGSKAFGEAWMIIECKKLVTQPLEVSNINDPELKQEWEGKQMHTMFMGEIINVWIK